MTSQADQSYQRLAGRGRLDSIAGTTASSCLPPQRTARHSQINDCLHEKINKQSSEPAFNLSLPGRHFPAQRNSSCKSPALFLLACSKHTRDMGTLWAPHGLTSAAPDPTGTAAGSSRPVLSLHGHCHSRRGHPGGHHGVSPSGIEEPRADCAGLGGCRDGLCRSPSGIGDLGPRSAGPRRGWGTPKRGVPGHGTSLSGMRDNAAASAGSQGHAGGSARSVPPEQPHPQRARRCGAGGRAGSPQRNAHLPPRQSRARARGTGCKLSSSPGLRAGPCGAARSDAERNAPLPSSAPAAPQLRRRAGSTGAASFSSGRPPPFAEPAGRRAGGGAGRAGPGRGGGRGGGAHLRLGAPVGCLSAPPHLRGCPAPACMVCIIPAAGCKGVPHLCACVCIIPAPRTHKHPHTCAHTHVSTHPACLRAVLYLPITSACMHITPVCKCPGCTARPLGREGMHTNTLSHRCAHTSFVHGHLTSACTCAFMPACPSKPYLTPVCTHSGTQSCMYSLQPRSSCMPQARKKAHALLHSCVHPFAPLLI